ncbi:hypothetical protein OsJ_19914 [Oryza sativa Japonica Group]|uniref:Uncharacterized protein n=1 Tax=Oryza sativa subsp. japonica TaxID=39947 RepID=B9FR83_ORYSJ|nr:hypothetical protein OsJ_19914 [Oryza sativa Japonica Group]
MGGDGKRTKLPWLGVARDVDDDGGPFTNCSSDLHIFDDDDDASPVTTSTRCPAKDDFDAECTDDAHELKSANGILIKWIVD